MNTFVYGFSLGFSLIFAIGAQNAFVLKQGLKGEHVFMVSLICALSDAILILIGVSGFHLLVSGYPGLVTIARYGGVIFLVVYGLLSFRKAWKSRHALMPGEIASGGRGNAALICLAFTWLNPHVYLDTVVLPPVPLLYSFSRSAMAQDYCAQFLRKPDPGRYWRL